MNLADTLESAYVAVLAPEIRTALGLSGDDVTPCFPGKNDSEKTFPVVVCRARQGDEYPKDAGNFRCQVEVEIRWQVEADSETDQKAANLALILAVETILQSDDLEAQLAASVDDLHIFTGSLQRSGVDRINDQDASAWAEVHNHSILACGSTLA